ncbi:MAG: site-specific DNA-methyltransferase [Dehalococcoidia bacterium]|nr:site-specific DNA-methyltransferase [Dehalococcoidia bacterium]
MTTRLNERTVDPKTADRKPHSTRIRIEHVPIGSLYPDPANPRRIGEAELDALTRSIRAFGLVDPLIARRADRVVIGGHQRLLAARRVGLATVPVVFVDLGEEQAKLLNVALNKISGEWDETLLAQLLKDLGQQDDIDLTLTGFDTRELDTLLASLDADVRRDQLEQFDIDAALADVERVPLRTEPGDLWVLGRHRLLCGDSTQTATYERLMAGERAALLATDPPYLVDYTGGQHPSSKAIGGRKTKDRNWDEYHDPEVSVDFFVSFLRAALAHCTERVPVYQWHAHRRQALVEEAWKQAGLFVHQQLIWVKSRAVLTRSHFMWQHEPAFYGWRNGGQPERKPPSGSSTVWEVGQQGEQFGIHPTQKPVELFIRPIEAHTDPGDVVLEPFSGSGTQIIAAERTGRRCFAIDQEPRFVDVAVMRWEVFTGLTAVKESGS